MTLNACIRKGKKSQIRDLRFYIRKLEKKKKQKYPSKQKKEVRAEISDIENL